MPQLNVQVTGAPGPVIVTLSVVEKGKESTPFVVFPTSRQTDPAGWTNFINLQSGQKLPPLLCAVTCQQYTTPADQPVLFDSSTDVTISIPYAPFKKAVPVIARPPLPLPLPDPTRDADVWATILPWDPGFGASEDALAATLPPTAMSYDDQGRTEESKNRIPIQRKPRATQYATAVKTEAEATGPTSRDYLRGDAWGVVMPGAPLIDGGSAETPDQILSWFIDRYPLDFQKEYLTKYAGYGYTHFYLSPPDSIQGFGFSMEQFIETVRLVKKYVPYVGIMLSSKYFQKQDMTVDEYKAYPGPLLDALLPEADEFCPFWEGNLYNIPGQVHVDITRYVGQRCHAAGKSCWLHFSPHVTSWFADGDPRGRFGFWDDLEGDCDGINYQTNPEWTTQEMADRMVDTLWQFGEDGNRYKFRLWEDKATQQYWGHATPDDGDARGY